MYTQCPECQTYRPISVEELRKSQGMICCKTCRAMYDALQLLSEGPLPKENNAGQPSTSFKENLGLPHRSKPSVLWKTGFGLCLITLILQLYYFEAYKLTQNPLFRPWLEKTCQVINCQLPPYKNLNEISILNGSFEVIDEQSYLFKAAFSNQSTSTQTLPAIKLSLKSFTGQVFAQRIFYPQEYSNNTSRVIEPNMSTEITLSISAPSSHIGGYHFELI